MHKSNFNKVGEEPVQATVCTDAARHHTQIFMDAEIKGYSQWFGGKLNNVANSLSWIGTRTTKNSPQYSFSTSHNRCRCNFKISPLPNEINSWLILLLQCLPVNKRLREEHMMTNLAHGPDGKSTVSQLDAETSSWTASASKSKSSCLEHLPGCQERKILLLTFQHIG
jgi:hypothetical protein